MCSLLLLKLLHWKYILDRTIGDSLGSYTFPENIQTKFQIKCSNFIGLFLKFLVVNYISIQDQAIDWKKIIFLPISYHADSTDMHRPALYETRLKQLVITEEWKEGLAPTKGQYLVSQKGTFIVP